MGNRNKFDKIERNDTYYEAYGEEEITEKKKKKDKKNKIKDLSGLDASNVPEKEKPSFRFTFTKEKRKVIYDNEKTSDVTPPSKAPFVFMLTVFCLVLLMSFALTSNRFNRLDDTTAAAVKAGMYILAYLVPSIIYLVIPHSGKHLHNIRRFSVSTLAFSASCLGLMLCLTALQKYLIAYSFSYSEPTVAVQGNIWLGLVTGALLPAVCEELFVRGILQHKISEYAGGFCGITVGALVFAMLHFELQYFMIYFVSGLVLGAVTHVTRSVFPAIAVHFLNNALSIVFSEKLSFVATERIGGTLLIIVLAGICFGFLILTLHLAETISEKRAEKSLKMPNKTPLEGHLDGERNAFFLLSPQGKTATRSFKVVTNPFMLSAVAIFIIIVFVTL